MGLVPARGVEPHAVIWSFTVHKTARAPHTTPGLEVEVIESWFNVCEACYLQDNTDQPGKVRLSSTSTLDFPLSTINCCFADAK